MFWFCLHIPLRKNPLHVPNIIFDVWCLSFSTTYLKLSLSLLNISLIHRLWWLLYELIQEVFKKSSRLFGLHEKSLFLYLYCFIRTCSITDLFLISSQIISSASFEIFPHILVLCITFYAFILFYIVFNFLNVLSERMTNKFSFWPKLIFQSLCILLSTYGVGCKEINF